MSQSSSDLRVRRTQKLIRDALIALIEERSFDAITVGDITRRAMVSRTAFYRYYRDKFDMVEKLYEEIMNTVIGELDLVRQGALDHFDRQPQLDSWSRFFEQAERVLPVPEPIVKYFDHVLEYESLYHALLGGKGSSWFVMKMRVQLTHIASKDLQELATALGQKSLTTCSAYADGLVPALIAAQVIDSTTWWLEHGKPYSPRQMATFCYRVMCSILKDVPKWE
jgi:AcrR family transcriptional regulator